MNDVATIARDPPFWSDDFDMDFPKIFPDARKLLGTLGDVELVTTCHPCKTGRLNMPTVWNGDHSMLSFFGFKTPARPPFYATSRETVITCTAWEAFRDAWPHGYLIQVERQPIWDTFPLWKHFETLMWDVRNWGHPSSRNIPAARHAVMKSYLNGIAAFGRVVNAYASIPAHQGS